MFVKIETSTGVPITRQIGDQIRAACASGTLRPGERLPSVREMARLLTVNQNTILRVYERLTAEGLLERRHGDGTYVADDLPSGGLRQQRDVLRDEFRRLVRKARVLGMGTDQLRGLFERTLAEPDDLALVGSVEK